MALPTPTHEKEREANQRGTRGREEDEYEEDPYTEQRHSQWRLHGTHAHPFWADSGHLAPLSHTPLSWYLARLGTWRRGLVTPPVLLGVNQTKSVGDDEHEECAQPQDLSTMPAM